MLHYTYYRKMINAVRLLRIYCWLLVLPVVSNGCAKFVTVDPPKDRLIATDVYESELSTRSALAGIYYMMYDMGILSAYMNMTPYWVDEFKSHSLKSEKLEYYRNLVLPTSPRALNYTWSYPFNHLYNINMLIEGVNAAPKLSQSFKNEMMGQGLFLRAYMQFFLVNCFGSVPYVETGDYTVNQHIQKQPVDTVLARIHRDLDKAISLLTDNYTTAGNRIYPNRFVAKAFKARVCLHTADWNGAISLTSDIINRQDLYKLEPDLAKVFLYQSPETIWQFKALNDASPAKETSFILTAAPLIGDGTSLSRTVLEDFEHGDKRRKEWVDSLISTVGNITDTFYYPFKYKTHLQSAMNAANREYSVVIRLAELLLIRAEAYAQKEMFDEACDDINALRQRADLLDFHSVNKEEVLRMVLDERRRELFTEGQHRFFDLKRMGKANEILGQRKPNWTPQCFFFPKPEKDLLANPNL